MMLKPYFGSPSMNSSSRPHQTPVDDSKNGQIFKINSIAADKMSYHIVLKYLLCNNQHSET
mgnify:CR=1 FL=1